MAYVQAALSDPLTSTSASSTSQAYPLDNTAGNALVAMVCWNSSTGVTATGLADTQGNTWAQVSTSPILDSTSNKYVAVYVAFNCNAGPNTITLSLSGSTGSRSMIISEYSGANSVDVVAAQNTTNTTASNNVTSGSATTTASGEQIVAYIVNTSGTASISVGTSPNAFTSRAPTSNVPTILEDFTQSSAGSIAATATIGTAGRYIAFMIALSATLTPLTPSLVQSSTATSGSSNGIASLTATYGSTPTQGNLLVAAAGSDATLTMSSSGWSLAVSAIFAQAAYIWYKIAGVSESTTVQVTPGSSDTVVLAIMEFGLSSGTWVSSPLDRTVSNTINSTVTSLSTGTTAATSVANELAIAIVNPHDWGVTAPNSPSWTNSFTNIVTVAGTTGSTSGLRVALFVASLNLTATGTQTSTASWANASNNAGTALATFMVQTIVPTPAPWITA